MSSPSLPNNADVASPVRYGTEAYDQSLGRLMEEDASSRARLLFHGGIREQRQEALATLTRYTTANVHQFQVPSLLGEQRMQTQNSLRKAFDHATEEGALLYFDKADALFTHTHTDTSADEEEDAVPTTVEYFFDRVGAYDGVVVLGLQRTQYVEWAEDKVHLIVRFE